YIRKDNMPFMSVSFDRVNTQMWWASANFIEIEPELNEIAYTDADPAMRQYMERVLQTIITDIQTEFPYIKRDLTPKYNKSFDILHEKLPFMIFLIHSGMHSSNGMFMVLFGGIMLCILGYFAFQKLRMMKPVTGKSKIA
ncbi:MAG TPA: hypothetical protein VGL10_05975, partial [Gammaproteobacteria bacterium]